MTLDVWSLCFQRWLILDIVSSLAQNAIVCSGFKFPHIHSLTDNFLLLYYTCRINTFSTYAFLPWLLCLYPDLFTHPFHRVNWFIRHCDTKRVVSLQKKKMSRLVPRADWRLANKCGRQDRRCCQAVHRKEKTGVITMASVMRVLLTSPLHRRKLLLRSTPLLKPWLMHDAGMTTHISSNLNHIIFSWMLAWSDWFGKFALT